MDPIPADVKELTGQGIGFQDIHMTLSFKASKETFKKIIENYRHIAACKDVWPHNTPDQEKPYYLIKAHDHRFPDNLSQIKDISCFYKHGEDAEHFLFWSPSLSKGFLYVGT